MFQDDIIELIFGKHVKLLGLNFEIHLYGLFIAIGILFCIFVLYKYTEKKGMPMVIQDFCFFSAIFAIVIGFFFSNLFQAFYVWVSTGVFDLSHAGITAMGGFAGGTAAFLAVYFGVGRFYFKGKDKDLHKKEFNKILTVAPLCVLIAHAFGRIGCLMGGCCHGSYLGKEYVFGGIWMNPGDGVAGYYVPTQLYEALFLFALFGVLSYLYLKKDCNITPSIYLISYGVWRFLIEFLRDDYRGGAFLSLQPSQWFSIVFIVCGIFLLLFYKYKNIPFTIHYEPREKEKK